MMTQGQARCKLESYYISSFKSFKNSRVGYLHLCQLIPFPNKNSLYSLRKALNNYRISTLKIIKHKFLNIFCHKAFNTLPIETSNINSLPYEHLSLYLLKPTTMACGHASVILQSLSLPKKGRVLSKNYLSAA